MTTLQRYVNNLKNNASDYGLNFSSPSNIYTVKEGDTCEYIASLYNISTQELINANPKYFLHKYVYVPKEENSLFTVLKNPPCNILLQRLIGKILYIPISSVFTGIGGNEFYISLGSVYNRQKHMHFYFDVVYNDLRCVFTCRGVEGDEILSKNFVISFDVNYDLIRIHKLLSECIKLEEDGIRYLNPTDKDSGEYKRRKKSKKSKSRRKKSKSRRKRSKTSKKSKKSKKSKSRRKKSNTKSKANEKSSKEKIILQKSNRSEKKYMVTIGKKTIHFGSSPYKSYEIHKDKARMLRYLNRHRSRENWSKSGIKTAGFWSRWILWNKPSLLASIKDTEKRFNIHIQRKK